MWNPRVPSCIVRWLCHIPTGAAGLFSLIKYYSLAGVSTKLVDAIDNSNALFIRFYLNGIIVSRHRTSPTFCRVSSRGHSLAAHVGHYRLHLELHPVHSVTEYPRRLALADGLPRLRIRYRPHDRLRTRWLVSSRYHRRMRQRVEMEDCPRWVERVHGPVRKKPGLGGPLYQD